MKQFISCINWKNNKVMHGFSFVTSHIHRHRFKEKLCCFSIEFQMSFSPCSLTSISYCVNVIYNVFSFVISTIKKILKQKFKIIIFFNLHVKNRRHTCILLYYKLFDCWMKKIPPPPLKNIQ